MIAVLLKKDMYYFADVGQVAIPLGPLDTDHAAKISKAVGPFYRMGRYSHDPVREVEREGNENRVRSIRAHPELYRVVSYA